MLELFSQELGKILNLDRGGVFFRGVWDVSAAKLVKPDVAAKVSNGNFFRIGVLL
jgi:hypothetical protein